jgi:hypothetical protein
MLLVGQALFGSKGYAGVDCRVDDIVEDWKACVCFYEKCLWVQFGDREVNKRRVSKLDDPASLYIHEHLGGLPEMRDIKVASFLVMTIMVVRA